MTDIAEAFAELMFAPRTPPISDEVRDLQKYSKEDLRRFWDCVGDNSFYDGPEGSFDVADIHYAMNLNGDGGYCIV